MTPIFYSSSKNCRRRYENSGTECKFPGGPYNETYTHCFCRFKGIQPSFWGEFSYPRAPKLCKLIPPELRSPTKKLIFSA